jgi:hypothetical protein
MTNTEADRLCELMALPDGKEKFVRLWLNIATDEANGWSQELRVLWDSLSQQDQQEIAKVLWD